MCNFWPLKMAGKGDDEIKLVVLLYYIISGLSCGSWLGGRKCVISGH